MTLSSMIRAFWREVEDVLTAATGPLLIVSSAVSTSDIFSNQTFSGQLHWLPAVWAIARALAVTMWLGVAFEYYLNARSRQKSGFWWFTLSMILFVVDLQTATLFAFQAEHISNLGEWALLKIPAIDWAIEQAVLGVILIAVHRAVIHQKAEKSPAVANPTGPIGFSSPPLATPAVYYGMVNPPTQPMQGYSQGYPQGFSQGHPAPVTGYTDTSPSLPVMAPPAPSSEAPAAPVARPRRIDSGQQSATKEQRIQLLAGWLRDDPRMSITDCQRALEARGFTISRATVSEDRRLAHERL